MRRSPGTPWLTLAIAPVYDHARGAATIGHAQSIFGIAVLTRHSYDQSVNGAARAYHPVERACNHATMGSGIPTHPTALLTEPGHMLAPCQS